MTYSRVPWAERYTVDYHLSEQHLEKIPSADAQPNDTIQNDIMYISNEIVEIHLDDTQPNDMKQNDIKH